jgi:serine/threonine-protein kinase
VCPVYDLFLFDTPRGLVAAATMPRFRGESLAARLSRGLMPPAEALRIAGGIAAGIDALHSAGLAHRDLKPGNIMLTPGPGGAAVPVLLDFGLAEPLSVLGTSTLISGSPDYMAPEQFRRASATPAADIYAFGLILFEMLAGRGPFPAEELLPAIVRRNTEDAPVLSDVASWTPRAWDAPIARALSRDAARRPGSATELIEAVRRKWAEVEVCRVRIACGCAHHPPRRMRG